MVRLTLLVLAAVLGAGTTAQAAVPDDFVGVISDGPMITAPDINTEKEFKTMARSRVGSVRFSVYWNEIRPYETTADVPAERRDDFPTVEGVPTNWTALDRTIGQLTAHDFDLLPVVLRAPAWARRDPRYPHSSPTEKGRAAYARFLEALIHRYGPDGEYWEEHPYDRPRPIRRWQIWNEPNGPAFWQEQPGIPAYIELLEQAAPAVREADPGAQVVLAGLFGKAWKPLRRIYLRGGGGLFDVAAVNPFTLKLSNVLLVIRKARDIMNRNGDAKMPLLATEISWPSAKGKTTRPYGFEVTEKGQAQRVRTAVSALARQRGKLGLTGFFWSSWISYDENRRSSFDYAGLRRYRNGKVTNKPAFGAFRRVVRRITEQG